MPVVSVIMPVYNAEQFLDCSVGSVLSQTYDGWELICFNDDSTDRSPEILSDYARRESRIRVIDSAVNVKQGAGRNRAIREARGEYVMFLDADDSLRSDAIELCVAAIQARHADMVMFDYETIPGGIVAPLGCDASSLSTDSLRRRISERPSPIWSAMYRRSLFIDNDLFFPERVFFEDNAVALALQLSAPNPVKIDAPLYFYHIYDTSVSHRLDDYRFFHRLSSALTLKGHLLRLGLYDRYRDAIDFVLFNQYYANTITGCVYRFKRVPMLRQHYVRETVNRVVPHFRDNPHYRHLPLSRRLSLGLHARFPRLINFLWCLKRHIR